MVETRVAGWELAARRAGLADADDQPDADGVDVAETVVDSDETDDDPVASPAVSTGSPSTRARRARASVGGWVRAVPRTGTTSTLTARA